MTQKETLLEEIDRYLQGEMEEDTKVNFEKRLDIDAEVRNEVELQKLIIKTVRKNQLQKIVQKEEDKIKRSAIIKKIIAVGSFAVAASFSGFLYLGYINNCTNLANRYYVTYANIYELPSRGGETLHPSQTDSLFFDSLKQLEKGKNRSAAKQLLMIENDPSELHASSENAVKWYLSLAYLKSGKKSKAKALLQKIAEDQTGEFHSEAIDLLKELEN